MRVLIFVVLACLCGCSSQPEAVTAPRAPDVFRVKFDTSKGAFVVEAHRAWAPNGADRFYDLAKQKFFDDTRFFRVVKGFMVQFGISGDPKTAESWRAKMIPDDPVKEGNVRGNVSFAMAGPGTRTTQLFINFADNSQSLDPQGFAAFGRVVSGMDVVDQINAQYGESPDQGRIQAEGNDYLKQAFPNLDYIKTARVE